VIDVKHAGMSGEPSASADSETKILQSIIDNAKDDSVIYFPRGVYNLKTVTVSGKSLSFVSDENALIVQHADAPVFDLYGGWSSVTPVASLQEDEVNFTSGGSQTTRITELELDGDARQAGFRPGDIVKIYSQDVIPGSKPGEREDTARRTGEFAVALRVEGNRVILDRLLREAYKTRVGVAKFSGHTFMLRGLRFDTLDIGDEAGWSKEYLSIRACPDLRISDLSCRRGWGSFIKLVGCFAYRIEGVAAMNLKNMASQGIYGYGINDFSSDGGVVTGCLFVNCRHGFTTNTSALAPGDGRIEYYGRTANIIVSNCHGYACSNSAFDTHDEAWNIQFENCVAQGSYRGNNALGDGFSGRGRHIRFNHCTAVNCNVGFSSTESYPQSSSDHVFFNCKAINSSLLAAEMKRTGSGERMRGVRFEFCHLESSGEYVLNFRHSDIFMTGTTVRSLNATGASAKLINLESAALEISDCRFAIEPERPDDTPKFFRIVGESSVAAARIEVYHPRHAVQRVAESPSANPSPLMMEDVRFRILPTHPPYNLDNYRIGAWAVEDGATTAYRELKGDAAALLETIRHSADPLAVIDLVPGTIMTVDRLPPGWRPMQRLLLRNRAGAAGGAIVALSAEGQTVWLLPGDRVELLWNGNEWIRIG